MLAQPRALFTLAPAALIVAGCAASTTSTGGDQTSSQVPGQTAGTPAAPTSTPLKVSSSAAEAGSFRMPNEVGKDLQSAQDDIQRVSGDPVFFTHSHDLISGRMQILDRDWKVCTQDVAPGRKASATEHIDFGVVKQDESCP